MILTYTDDMSSLKFMAEEGIIYFSRQQVFSIGGAFTDEFFIAGTCPNDMLLPKVTNKSFFFFPKSSPDGS